MKKLMLLLLAVVAVDGVANEVGASFPQATASAPQVAISIAETGASQSWANLSTSEELSPMTEKELQMHVEGFDAKFRQEIEQIISEKLDALLISSDI